MNIFRILSSGKPAFREEFVSAFLAYLLSPKMDHGLGGAFLENLLNQIARRNDAPELKALAGTLKSRLWEDLFADGGQQPVVELEVKYPKPAGHGWIDVVVRLGQWIIMIENKIQLMSKTDDQIKEQYAGLQSILRERGIQDDYKILVLYLVPASGSEESWSVPQGFYDELEKVALRPGDQSALVSWQPAQGVERSPVSVVRTIRDLLSREAKGLLSPINIEVRQTLLSLVDYVMGDFQGYYYEKATPSPSSTDDGRMSVRDILNLDGEYFIGVKSGRAGVVGSAWRNPEFLNTKLTVTEDGNRGWMYLPLEMFKIFALWAMDPENRSLEGIQWYGKPFDTVGVYRVAKWGKTPLFIGIKGGEDALQNLDAETIRNRKGWELWGEQKNKHWIPAERFCEILQNKGISYG